MMTNKKILYLVYIAIIGIVVQFKLYNNFYNFYTITTTDGATEKIAHGEFKYYAEMTTTTYWVGSEKIFSKINK